MDLVAANTQSNYISVLLGNGNGTFQTADIYTTLQAPSDVAVGDFNGDGRQDVVVAHSNNNHVSVFLSNANGALAPAVPTLTSLDPKSVAVSDLNGDGKEDLVITGVDDAGAPKVSALLGNGSGSFFTTGTYVTGTTPQAVAIADVDRDGRQDLVTACYGTNSVSIMRGNGDGTFASYAQVAVGTGPVSLDVGDLTATGESTSSPRTKPPTTSPCC